MKSRHSTRYVILHIILYVSFFLEANSQKISQIGKVDPGTCDAKSRGKRVVVVDSKDNDRVLFCVKNNGQYIWRPLDDGPTLGEYFNPVRDCSEIVLRKSDATNGFYWMRTVGLANITKIWCDVTTDGGGFMLVGHIDSPHTWNVTSNSNVMFPSDKPRWSSAFGSVSMIEFRIQLAVIDNSQKCIADWTYRFKKPRRFTDLLVDDRGCTKKYPGIGDIEYVKDLVSGETVTKNFLCSQFGTSYSSTLGWKRMNKCLGKTCAEGYAIIPGLGLQYDNFGSFSYSINSQRSGINGNSSAFIGCDHGKCCACFGAKGKTGDSCLPGCRGTVSQKAQAWFWIRSSIPEHRFMKKCMEYLVKTDRGNIETHFIDPKTGILTKGSCKTKGVANLIDGTLSLPDKESLDKLPSVPGLISYRKDNKKVYVNQGSQWEALSREKEVEKLKATLQQLQNRLQGKTIAGVVYTRWGRKTCPKTSKVVYSGAMAGSYFTHSGGGSNYLCLTLRPTYNRFKAGTQMSKIYGSAYDGDTILSQTLHHHNAPCAVCYAESRVSKLMIPASNVCPSGWTREYEGYIMAENTGHKRTEYICVDGKPSALNMGKRNQHGALLYYVEGICGSLPCGPYRNGYELTCAVCTK